MQCSHLTEVNAKDMTLHLLDHFVPRGLDEQRDNMRDFINGHYSWFKSISETYLKCLGLDAVTYAKCLAEPGYPWDLLAIVLFSRMWRLHCCVLFEDYLFISREDENAELCQIRLLCIGTNKFCLVDDLRVDRSWNNLIIRTAVRNIDAEDNRASNNDGSDSESSHSPADNTDEDADFDIGAVEYSTNDSSEGDLSLSDLSSVHSERHQDEGYASSQQSGDETEEIDYGDNLHETGTNGNVISNADEVETENNDGQTEVISEEAFAADVGTNPVEKNTSTIVKEDVPETKETEAADGGTNGTNQDPATSKTATDDSGTKEKTAVAGTKETAPVDGGTQGTEPVPETKLTAPVDGGTKGTEPVPETKLTAPVDGGTKGKKLVPVDGGTKGKKSVPVDGGTKGKKSVPVDGGTKGKKSVPETKLTAPVVGGTKDNDFPKQAVKRGRQTANSCKAGYWEEPRQMDVGPSKKPKCEKKLKPLVQTPSGSDKKTSVATAAGKIDVSVHALKKHKKKQRTYKCHLCSEKFTSQNQLTSHLSTDHADSKLSCKHCGHVVKTRDALLKHEKSHEERECKCEVCGKCFQFKYQLDNHLKVHSQTNMYRCLHCTKQFTTNAAMLHHDKTHQTKITCDDCPEEERSKVYNSIENYRQHWRGAHGDGWTAPCDLNFKWKSKYHRHMKACDTCKAFNEKKKKDRFFNYEG